MIILSNFDELFNNVSASAMSELVNADIVLSSLRDSKIKLVTELDSEHPLKAGEYYFSEYENILYVGAGVIDSIKLYITDFLQHHTSIRVIEAPRIKFSNLIPTLVITHNTSNKHKVAARLYFNNTVSCTENIYHSTSDRVTNTLEYSLSNNVSAVVTHRTEVI